MKYYFAYDANGELLAIEMCGNTGWPNQCDLWSDDPQDPTAKDIRALRLKANPETVGFAIWDCGCQSVEDYGDNINPACEFMHAHIYDIDAGVFLPKPDVSLYINNEAKMVLEHGCLTDTPIYDYVPGSKVNIKFSGTVPNGTTLKLDNTNSAVAALQNGNVVLTFTNNFTEEIEATIPFQGMGSIFHVSGRLVCTGSFALRGWQP